MALAVVADVVIAALLVVAARDLVHPRDNVLVPPEQKSLLGTPTLLMNFDKLRKPLFLNDKLRNKLFRPTKKRLFTLNVLRISTPCPSPLPCSLQWAQQRTSATTPQPRVGLLYLSDPEVLQRSFLTVQAVGKCPAQSWRLWPVAPMGLRWHLQ